jgi:hypothetical protein
LEIASTPQFFQKYYIKEPIMNRHELRDMAITGLRAQIERNETQNILLRRQIAELTGKKTKFTKARKTPAKPRKRRKMSAEARKRVGDATRARFAAKRAEKEAMKGTSLQTDFALGTPVVVPQEI